MAKRETLKLDEFKLDGDLDFDSFMNDDITGQINPELRKGKKRTVVSDAISGSISGAKSTFSNPAFLAKVVKDSLPSSYGTVFGEAGKIAETSSALYDEAVKDIKPQLSRLAKKVDKLVPEEKKSLKKLTGKISSFFGDESDMSKGPTKDQVQDQSIATSLGAIFGAQQEAQDNIQARSSAESKIRDQVEHKRYESNFGILSSINDRIIRVSNYTEKVTQAYQKKSLELQFRSYFVQTEMLATTTKYFEAFKAQNDAITRNTALPEYVKINTSERFMQHSKNKFMEGAYNSIFGDDTPIGRGLKKLKQDGKNYLSGVKQGLEAAMMGLEGIEQLQDMQKMMAEMGDTSMTSAHMAGTAFGGFAANKAGEFASKHLGKHLEKIKGVRDTGNRLAHNLRNLSGVADDRAQKNNWDEKAQAGGLKGMAYKILNYGRSAIREYDPDMKVDNPNGISGLKMGTIFDGRTQRSIVEIIPGYLAHILRELTVIRSGDNNVGITMFDHTSGKFVSKKELGTTLMKGMAAKVKGSMYGHNLDKAHENLFGYQNQSELDKTFTKEFLAKLAAIPNLNATPENILNTRVFGESDRKTQSLVRKALEVRVTKSEDKHARQNMLSSSIEGIKSSTTDLRGEIESYIKLGYGEVLEQEGVVKAQPDGSYEIDKTAYFKFLRDNGIKGLTSVDENKSGLYGGPGKGHLDVRMTGTARSRRNSLNGTSLPPKYGHMFGHKYTTSDFNVKESIKALSPRRALKAIANTKLFSWKYKPGHEDRDTHEGPMAQDVRRNMGDEAAPGGKKIDLTTMNGNNMAAIQELKRNQDKHHKSDEGTKILGRIAMDTKNILRFMVASSKRMLAAKGNGHGSSGNGDYASIMGSMFGNAGALLSKGTSDVISAAGGAFNFAKDSIVKPAAKKVGEFYNNNKDQAKEGLKLFLGKTWELANRGLAFSGDILFNKLPAGAKWLAQMGQKAKDKLKELFNGARDVYIKGKDSPVLKASLIKAGYYRDSISGKVITCMDDLKDLKGNIINAAGETILTIEEAADGLYDQYGEKIKSTLTKAVHFVAGALAQGFNRAKDFIAENAARGATGLGKVTGFMKNAAGSVKDMFAGKGGAGGLGGGKIYEVLVEIRDILKKKEDEPTITSTEEAPTNNPDSKSTNPEIHADNTPKYAGGNILDGASKLASGIFSRGSSAIAGLRTKGAGWKGKLVAGFGGLFGGKKDQEQAPDEKAPQHHDEGQGEHREETKPNLVDRFKKAGSKVVKTIKGKLAFNDPRGEGHRDNDVTDRAAKLEQDKIANHKEMLKADSKAKYTSDENIIDTIMKKATGIFSMIGEGASDIFSNAGDLLGKAKGVPGGAANAAGNVAGKAGIFSKIGGFIKSPIKGSVGMLGSIGRGIGSAAGTIGKLALGGGSLAMRAGGLAVRGAMMGGGLLASAGSAALGAAGSALAAIGSALASPVVLGALAVAAVAYGGYKLYKYVTRDNANEFDDIRLKQYGLGANEKDKKFNHFIFKLEDYLMDGRVGYLSGKAYFLDKKIDPQDLLDIFSIDKDDPEMSKAFTDWFTTRFKPFFLTHMTAANSINNKYTIADVPSMKDDEKIKYLGLITFESGPYDVLVSPFKEWDCLNGDKTFAINAIKVLIDKLSKKSGKEGKKGLPPVVPPKAEPPKAISQDKVVAPLPATNTTPAMDKKETLAKALETGEGDGASQDAKPGDKKEEGSASVGKLKVADGPMRDGEGASQYMVLKPGVSFDNTNPEMLKNFKAMIQEYGEATGKKVTITSGSRTREEQEALFKKDPSKAAKPGSSLHEYGLALDADSAALNEMESLGLMRKYGFTRPVGGEPWHVEASAIGLNIQRAKNDPEWASQAVEASLNRGGGGAALSGVASGHRDPQLAMAIVNGSSTTVKSTDKDKVTDLAAANSDKYSSSQDTKVVSFPQRSVTKPKSNEEVSSTKVASSPSVSDAQSDKYSKNSSLPDTESKPIASNIPGADDKTIDTSNKTEVKDAISDIARKQGEEPSLLTAFAAVESSLNPNAKANGSSASGLYQFTKTTWNEQLAKNGRKHDLDSDASPTDIKASTLIATEYVKKNKKELASVKKDINLTDLYLAHFLGTGGAKRFLSAKQDALAASIMPDAARSNPNVFYDNGRPLTVKEVYDRLSSKLATAAKDYGITLPADVSFAPIKSASSGSSTQDSGKDTGVISGADANAPTATSSSKDIFQDTPSKLQVSRGKVSPDSAPGGMMNKPAVPSRKGSLISQSPTLLGNSGIDSSMSSGQGVDNISGLVTTSNKQLEVQIEMRDLLKQILENSDPAKLGDVLKGLTGNAPAMQNTKGPQGGRGQMTSIQPAVDLSRKAA